MYLKFIDKFISNYIVIKYNMMIHDFFSIYIDYFSIKEF